jgi:hypothetical protein
MSPAPAEDEQVAVQGKTSVSLFSYGTLQQPGVQLATFGRLLEGRADALLGFALEPLAITDAGVVALSGASVHTIARRTGSQADCIPGVVFDITPAELNAADAYEVSAVRIEVGLASGAKAFVYVSADETRATSRDQLNPPPWARRAGQPRPP